jgi:glycosyltransferase involved in cell wall biosynthesis
VPAATTLEAAALEALGEQTGIRGAALEQLYTFDREGGGAVCVAYLCLVPAERHPLAPGPGVVQVRWFPMDDPPALAEAITRLLRDPDLRARLGAAGRVKAQENTWDHVAARVRAVYEEKQH